MSTSNKKTKTVTPTFQFWMKLQKKRDDRIGDLARDALTDSQFPWRDTPYSMYWYLKDRGAVQGAVDALTDAWREYLQWCFGEAGDVVGVRFKSKRPERY